MIYPIEKREWLCTDDSPLNNGWGYNNPDPKDEEEEYDEDYNEEDIDDDGEDL